MLFIACFDTPPFILSDVKIGPIADDGVALQIGLFQDGYINLATLAEALKYRKLNNQYYFGTPKAIKLLKRI